MCLEKPDGRTITYKYDALDNQTQKDMDGNTFVYSYNKDNQVTNITKNNNLDTKITYNQFGDMTAVEQANGVVRYQYDNLGRRIGLTYPDGTKTNYEYDKNDNLLSTTTGASTTSYQYDAIGNVTQKTLPNGTVTSYTYNDNNQIATTKTITSLGTILTNMEYVYDERGNIISEKETVDGKTIDKTYTYDEEERLASSTHTTGMNVKEYAYSYDKLGNKTAMSETINGKITNKQYQFDSNNALTNDAGSKYEYDANGNVSKKTYQNGVVETFKYDSEGQLIETQSSIGKTITYAYDGLGNRTQKVEKTTIESSEDGAGFLAFLKTDNTYNEEYDQELVSQTTNEQLTNLHQTISDHLDTFNQTCPVDDEDGPKTSVTTINYINDINRPYTEVLQTTNKNNQPVHTYVYGNERLSDTKRGENTNYYAYDGKGSVVGQETATNKVALSFKVSYNDFGQPNRKMDNQYGYNGENHDYNGSQYLRARYYDTKTGTFGQQDSYMGSLGSPIAQNRYVYTHSNSINNSDPSGHRLVADMDGTDPYLDGAVHQQDRNGIDHRAGRISDEEYYDRESRIWDTYNQYTNSGNNYQSYVDQQRAAAAEAKAQMEREIAAQEDEARALGLTLSGDYKNWTPEQRRRYLRTLIAVCDALKSGEYKPEDFQEALNGMTQYYDSNAAYRAELERQANMSWWEKACDFVGKNWASIAVMALYAVAAVAVIAITFGMATPLVAVGGAVIAGSTIAVAGFVTAGLTVVAATSIYFAAEAAYNSGSISELDKQTLQDGAIYSGTTALTGIIIGGTYYLINNSGNSNNGGSTSKGDNYSGTTYDTKKLFKTQDNSYLNKGEVKSMMEAIEKDGMDAVPPIPVYVTKDGEALIVDGHHRYQAFINMGYDRVPIKYIHANQIEQYYRTIEDLIAGMHH